MEGKIAIQNLDKQFFAVELENDTYAVFEVLDSCKIRLGNLISGQLGDEGKFILNNDTTNKSFKAHIRKVNCDKTKAEDFLQSFL